MCSMFKDLTSVFIYRYFEHFSNKLRTILSIITAILPHTHSNHEFLEFLWMLTKLSCIRYYELYSSIYYTHRHLNATKLFYLTCVHHMNLYELVFKTLQVSLFIRYPHLHTCTIHYQWYICTFNINGTLYSKDLLCFVVAIFAVFVFVERVILVKQQLFIKFVHLTFRWFEVTCETCKVI